MMNSNHFNGLLSAKMSRRGMLAASGAAGVVLAARRFLAVPRLEAASPVSMVYQSRFPGVRPPAAAFDIVQLVQEFAPGAWTGWHTHDGSAYHLVLQGQLYLSRPGRIDYSISAGQAGQCGPGIHQPGNMFGKETMRRLVTVLLPSGGPIGQAATGPFTPTVSPTTLASAFRAPATGAPPEFDLVQALIEMETGGVSASYSLPGISLWTPISGQVIVDIAGSKTSYNPGQQFVLPPRQAAVLSTLGLSKAQVAFSVLHPSGVPLAGLEAAGATSAGAGIRPPATGDGGLIGR